ncbi:MAG: DNA polymerase III subunit gamma/tau [Clostridia bacterium]|nr:DNA polymerase III subunit gamma/tau [Clostridia bacterium]
MYQVLYRKWRPKTFSDVCGQPQVTSTLLNELREDRLSHAYLFTGSRGTGKTSCAKIFAKAVNCLNPQNGDPCNECEMCRAIDNGSCLDVIEIDAASNNGVDNIRDLRDEANFTPATAKFRVYIIDEVHMLSISAFNALLKTLEEPPEHVKFILATTEVHKLPSTILSRCQRFEFKHITPEDICSRLKYVCENEKLELTDGAAMLIARLADGAMRDALSLLDRCASFGGTIDEKTVEDAAGIAGRDYLFALADCIAEKDVVKGLEIIDTLHKNSCDMERLITELTNHFRNIMVAKTVKNYRELIICSDEELEKIVKQGERIKLETVLHTINRLNEALAVIKKSVNRRIEMETAFMSLCSPELDKSNDALLSRIAELEGEVRMLKSNGVKASVVKDEKTAEPVKREPAAEEEIPLPEEPPVSEEKTEEIAEPVKREEPKKEVKSGDEKPFDKWPEAVKLACSEDVPLIGFLTGTSAIIKDNVVFIKSDNPVLASFLQQENHTKIIRSAIFKITGEKYKLGIYNSNSSAPKKDPLEGFMKRAQGLGINVERKE